MKIYNWEEIISKNLVVICNNVYDLSTYKFIHPGGESVITRFLGKDATEVFQAIRHSSRAIEEMKKYLVGTVIDIYQVIGESKGDL